MSSSLQILKQLNSGNTWEIIATIVGESTLPQDIFVYENLGTTTLGEYQGVCDLDQYQRLQTFTGSIIPIFGNRFVKYTQAKISLSVNEDTTQAISVITEDVTTLSIAISSASVDTQIINIP